MQWTECLLTVNADAVDDVCCLLYDFGIHGLEIIDNTLTSQDKKELFVDYIDQSLEVNSNSEEIGIKFYFSQEENVKEKLSIVKEELERLKKQDKLKICFLQTSLSKEEDWAHNWKKYYKPFRVDDNIIIKPSWEKTIQKKEEDIVIDIDPGMAFGSGTHETTSMCISLIHQYIKQKDSVIDVGCGSGILGITAAKLGAEQVTCIDLDKHAVKIAKDNCCLNEVQETVSVCHGDLLSVVSIKAQIIVANIMADIVMTLTQEIKGYLKPKGLYIASGIILNRLDEVKNHLILHNFEILKVRVKGEWAAVAAVMKV